ncbi:MAG: nucleotidyl transferase AbiEii/AbiGii toxin family protein [Planctomycetes bacterium]|nr:nucleotidyl transferase AbiEii/AbiGii toxin family protein [Planctomycetota bacterium]
MQRGGILCGALLFAGGLGLGFWLGRSPPGAVSLPGVQEKGARPPTWEEIREGVAALRGLWGSGGGRRGRPRSAGESGPGGEREGGGWLAPATREESFAAFRQALASGDPWKARRALRDLEQSGGEPLSPERLEELGGLLGTADRELLRDLSRALAVAGGKEGLSLVMGFLEDSNQPLERRRQALDGLSGLPPEKAAEAVPALAAFLEKGPPPELERSAAHGSCPRRRRFDLFDLCTALDAGISPAAIVEAFRAYMQAEGREITRAVFEENLAAKLRLPAFMGDIPFLLPPGASFDRSRRAAARCAGPAGRPLRAIAVARRRSRRPALAASGGRPSR